MEESSSARQGDNVVSDLGVADSTSASSSRSSSPVSGQSGDHATEESNTATTSGAAAAAGSAASNSNGQAGGSGMMQGYEKLLDTDYARDFGDPFARYDALVRSSSSSGGGPSASNIGPSAASSSSSAPPMSNQHSREGKGLTQQALSTASNDLAALPAQSAAEGGGASTTTVQSATPRPSDSQHLHQAPSLPPSTEVASVPATLPPPAAAAAAATTNIAEGDSGIAQGNVGTADQDIRMEDDAQAQGQGQTAVTPVEQ